MQRMQWFLVLLATLMFSTLATAQSDAAAPLVLPPGAVGVVTNVQGGLSASKAGGSPRALAVYANVSEGDVLSTAAGSYARVKLSDGGELILRPNSRAEITRYSYKAATPASDGAVITLFKGGLRSLTGLMGHRNPEQIAFKTPTATIGIRGTEFGLLECKGNCADVMPKGTPAPPNGTHVDVSQGSVAVSNASGLVLVNAGQFAYVKSATSRPQQVPPSRGVRVTVPSTIRQDPPPKPQTGAAANTKSSAPVTAQQSPPATTASTALSSSTSDQSPPAAAAATGTSSTNSASSTSPVATDQSQPAVPAAAGTSSLSSALGNAASLADAIAQLPASGAGPTQQAAAPVFSSAPSFGGAPGSSFSGGGGGAVSRN